MVLDGWVLKGHKTLEWLGWEGPKRSQNLGIFGVGGSLKATKQWNFCGGRVLKGHRTLQLLGGEILKGH